MRPIFAMLLAAFGGQALTMAKSSQPEQPQTPSRREVYQPNLNLMTREQFPANEFKGKGIHHKEDHIHKFWIGGKYITAPNRKTALKIASRSK